MKTTYIFLADGFEEVEALGTLDVLRRGGVDVMTVSLNAEHEVTGSHGVTVKADSRIADIDAFDEVDFLVLPGGMPGASNLAACEKLSGMLKSQYAAGRGVAAICASPALVLSPLGILDGRRATCYPGMEPIERTAVRMTGEPVVVDGNVITGKGPACTFAFGLAILTALKGAEAAGAVAQGMLLTD